ncbi:uncharacterized protein LOC130748162 [Lotus japonicus]|uniref:uncharacterized protein LOC130748162 n=1 Tax=Lotus japonicus TaxID=34305 RepID=UPI00258FCEA6|nr:uncharacterized protein LOC130748162 [Lotus japonicus]
MNDSLLYQKSRIKWLKEGDANTKYIHFVVKGRSRENNLVGLELASGWTEDIEQVKRGVKTFFEIKFRKQHGLRPSLDVTRALSQMGSILEELKEDFQRIANEFRHSGMWPKGRNASFIALRGYRASLVFGKVIDEDQSAFLGGRYMHDSVIVANEVIHEARRKKKATLIFKDDFEKAYDSIDREFFIYMMQCLKFSEQWILWMRSCLESTSISIIVNGSPTDEFS